MSKHFGKRVKRDINQVEKRIYHGSNTQKTWLEAQKYCKDNGNRKLLSFFKDDPEETKEIHKVVTAYVKKLGMQI